MCKCLGDEFIPYLGIVMPTLLKAASQDPDVKVRQLDDDIEIDDEDDETETVFLGDRVVTIRSSILEEKATACQMLCCYADELKDGFIPYVKQVTDIMVPLLKFYFHEEVRGAAVQSLPELLEAAIVGAQKGLVDANFLTEMVGYIWPALMDILGQEANLDVLSTVLESTAEIVQMLETNFLTKEMVDTCFEKLHGVMNASEERRKGRIEDQAARGDEELEADLESAGEEEEEEEEVLDQVGTCIASFLKKYGDNVLPYVESLMPLTAKLLDKPRSPVERRIGICVLDDLLEHSPAAGKKYADQFFPVLMEGAAHEDPGLRQCSVYGLGIMAVNQSQFMGTHLNPVLLVLVGIIQQPQARSEEDLSATENAVSALGRIFNKFPESVDAGIVNGVWLPALPLVQDLSEAQAMHAQLVTMVEAGDSRILGDGNQNLTKIVQVSMKLSIFISFSFYLVSSDCFIWFLLAVLCT